ncbi:MAG: sigma-70 family RNA polymerase sigma factor [Planctomycetota bacterium]
MRFTGRWLQVPMETNDNLSRERSLRRAVLRGDDDAWNELYAESFRPLFAFVYHRTRRNRERTEEVVQETWVIAVKRIRAFDPDRGSFEGWVRGIASNVLRNRWRQWSRESGERSPFEELDALPGAPSSRLDLAEQIALAMTELPGRYQDVLRARYERQYSVLEIAEQSGVSPKATESLLGRARAAFRAAFERLDPPRDNQKARDHV